MEISCAPPSPAVDSPVLDVRATLKAVSLIQRAHLSEITKAEAALNHGDIPAFWLHVRIARRFFKSLDDICPKQPSGGAD